MVRVLSAAVAAFLLSSPLFASSYYNQRIDDAKAVYLTSKDFPVHGDGVADDSDAIQQAINKVQDTTNQGILFIPATPDGRPFIAGPPRHIGSQLFETIPLIQRNWPLINPAT